MAVAFEAVVEETGPVRRRWTVDEFEALLMEGRLGPPNQRFELLDGEIYCKIRASAVRIRSIRLTIFALRAAFGEAYDVNTHIPLELDRFNEPEPDATVLRGTARDFASREPEVSEVALLVEVAENAARGLKLRIYAQLGIAEYWIVNLRGRCLEVMRGPSPDGTWIERFVLKESESVQPLEPGLPAIPVAKLLREPRVE